MFSLEGGTPIAKILDSDTFASKKGKHKYLGLIKEEDIKPDDSPGYKLDPYCLVSEKDIIKELGGSTKQKLIDKKMKEKIKGGKLPKTGTIFILNDGILSPVPDIAKERDTIFVAGKSGSGKSYWTAGYLDNYCQLFPDNDLFMFSNVREDPAFARFEEGGPKRTKDKMTRIVLDKDYLEEIESGESINAEDLANSAVIFDDVDMITNKKIKEHIVNLRRECLEVGRHYNITVICTAHRICNNSQTKDMLNECDKTVIFPKSSNKQGITYFLSTYENFNTNQIRELLSLPSRWVMCAREDEYVMYSSGAYFYWARDGKPTV